MKPVRRLAAAPESASPPAPPFVPDLPAPATIEATELEKMAFEGIREAEIQLGQRKQRAFELLIARANVPRGSMYAPGVDNRGVIVGAVLVPPKPPEGGAAPPPSA